MRPRRPQQKEKPKYQCRHCQHSYGWCSKAIDGHFILCRCKFDEKTKYGKWCKFLKDPQCKHFIKREDVDDVEDEQVR